LLSRLISSLKRRKAAGLDELTGEYLQFSHPIVVSILVKLFNLFISTGHIPASFGASYTVPIPKCDGRTIELCLLMTSGVSQLAPLFLSYLKWLFSKDSQISLRHLIISTASRSVCMGCRDAIYTVRQVTERYISNGSTVNMSTLDLSKAFDRTNH